MKIFLSYKEQVTIAAVSARGRLLTVLSIENHSGRRHAVFDLQIMVMRSGEMHGCCQHFFLCSLCNVHECRTSQRSLERKRSLRHGGRDLQTALFACVYIWSYCTMPRKGLERFSSQVAANQPFRSFFFLSASHFFLVFPSPLLQCRGRLGTLQTGQHVHQHQSSRRPVPRPPQASSRPTHCASWPARTFSLQFIVRIFRFAFYLQPCTFFSEACRQNGR